MRSILNIKKLSIFLIFIFALFLISCDKMTDDEAKILEVKSALVVPTEVTTDLELINSYEIDGVTASIVWSSSNSDVITNEGKVNRGEEDVIVNLEVTITVNETSQSIIFTVKVIAKEKPSVTTYTITYDLQGGTCEDLVLEFTNGGDVVLPTPSKKGFVFLGWYQDNQKVTILENKNYQLVAKWQDPNDTTGSLTVVSDTEDLYVDYEAELSIEGYKMTDFNITAE